MTDSPYRNSPGAKAERARQRRNILAAVPVILVNATAFIGQFAWVRQHVPLLLPGQVLFAVTLESVAVYLAWHAHLAQLANDSAGRLKFAAYALALVIGAMNYSHYASHWYPNAVAVGFGLMSALSPWLWGIHSRRASRDKLLERGLVEEHSVRLGGARWTWHPLRSVSVTRHSAWTGETDPKRAIAWYDSRHEAGTAPGQLAPEQAGALRAGTVPELAPAAPERNGAALPAVPAAPEQPLPGTVPAGATVNGNAALSAQAAFGRKQGPPEQVVAGVRAALAAVPAGEKLPAARAVARELGHEDRWRRLAGQMLAEAEKARTPGAPVASVPAATPLRRIPAGMIAAPAATLPGGTAANG